MRESSLCDKMINFDQKKITRCKNKNKKNFIDFLEILMLGLPQNLTN